jgi:hypothetical protein
LDCEVIECRILQICRIIEEINIALKVGIIHGKIKIIPSSTYKRLLEITLSQILHLELLEKEGHIEGTL